MRQSSSEPLHTLAADALAALDQALGHAPHKHDQTLAEASRRLGILRDALISRQRQAGGDEPSRSQLETVNGIISLSLAAHFPLGEIPWPAVRQGRDALAGLSAQFEAAT